MIFGFAARHFNLYEQEVEFARENGFSFLQVWYDEYGILNKDTQEQVNIIKQSAFPAIFHALLDINRIEEHVPKLIEILKFLKHTEVIIHPVCKSEMITDDSIFKLAGIVKSALHEFSSEGITFYLENNSKLDPIHTTAREVKIMFEENPTLEFLLDVAHIDNYMHLQEMIQVRIPKMLHIADRNLEVIHEHLPIGQGNIDFEYVFGNILHNFSGRVIFEIAQSDEDILSSKTKLERYFKKG